MIALAGALLLLAPREAAPEDRVVVRVETILAREAEIKEEFKEADLTNAALQPQLRRLFRYRSYRLMGREHKRLGWGDPATFEIPGGRTLRVVPRAATPAGVALHVDLVQGKEVLMNSDLTLGRQGRVLVGGPGYEDGVLILWIGARQDPHPRAK